MYGKIAFPAVVLESILQHKLQANAVNSRVSNLYATLNDKAVEENVKCFLILRSCLQRKYAFDVFFEFVYMNFVSRRAYNHYTNEDIHVLNMLNKYSSYTEVESAYVPT